MPRIRMPRMTRAGRGSRDDTVTKTAETQSEDAPEAGNDSESTATKETKPAAGDKAPDPNLQERIEGLQGWMAELERKQARLTYFGALALLIALGAAGAALYFGLTTNSDSAKKSDLDALTKRVDSLEGAVTKNSKDTQNALNASIAQLQQSISGLQKQQSQAQATISSLQSQVAASAAAKNAAGTPGTAATPGTTTTTPKKP